MKGDEEDGSDGIPFLLPLSHFSSLYYSVSSFFWCHSTFKLSFILLLLGPGFRQPSIPPPSQVSAPLSLPPLTTPRPCLPASFQSINSVLMCYAVPMISDHLRPPPPAPHLRRSLPGTGSRPGITVRIYVAPVGSCFIEETQTQRSSRRVKKRRE